MNQKAFKSGVGYISSLLRKHIWFAYLILLNIVIRIPRTSGLLGADSFTMIAWGFILSKGYYLNWTLSPFSIFGLYSFGSYPIGAPFVIGVLINLGLTYEIIVLGISMTCGIIGAAGAYSLGKRLFKAPENAILFAAFYSFSHIFYRFTYFSISARGPFLAILPWFLLFGLSFLRDRTPKCAALTAMSFLVLALFHGLAIFLVVYLVVVVTYFVYQYLLGSQWPTRFVGVLRRRIPVSSAISSSSSHRGIIVDWVFIIILLMGSYYIGSEFFYIDEGKITPLFLSNDSFIGLTSNLIIDYGLRLGILSIFFPLGIIRILSRNRRSPMWLANITLLSIVMFAIPKSLYASVIFLPVFGYYSIVGYIAVRERVSTHMLGGCLSVLVLLYTVMYNSLVVPLFTWIMILSGVPLFLFCASFLSFSLTNGVSKRERRNYSRIGPHIVILSILIFSLVTTEGLNLNSDYSIISEDEIQIIDYLKAQENIGLTFVFSNLVTVHIAAYGIPTVPMGDGIASLYYGLANSSDIVASSHFDILEIFRTGKLYRYEGDSPAYAIFNDLFGLDLTSQTEWETAITLGLQYVIVEKNQSGYASSFRVGAESMHCELLHSAPIACESVLETESMALFQLSL